MIYAVVDTNVYVSSFISKNPQSPTKKVIEMMLDGTITPLYDEDILKEYDEVLKRKKFKVKETEVDRIINYVREYGIPTSRTSFPEPMPDETDRVFFEITLTVEESFLVTGNLKHYPRKPQVVTPAEFLNLFESNQV